MDSIHSMNERKPDPILRQKLLSIGENPGRLIKGKDGNSVEHLFAPNLTIDDFDFLKDNLDLIPEECQTRGCILFWGAILLSENSRYVPAIRWHDLTWESGFVELITFGEV